MDKNRRFGLQDTTEIRQPEAELRGIEKPETIGHLKVYVPWLVTLSMFVLNQLLEAIENDSICKRL